MDIFKNISLRKKRIAGLLLSEKTLKKKDIIALNLELYAAVQAIHSAQRELLIDGVQQIKACLKKGQLTAARRHVSMIEQLLDS